MRRLVTVAKIAAGGVSLSLPLFLPSGLLWQFVGGALYGLGMSCFMSLLGDAVFLVGGEGLGRGRHDDLWLCISVVVATWLVMWVFWPAVGVDLSKGSSALMFLGGSLVGVVVYIVLYRLSQPSA